MENKTRPIVRSLITSAIVYAVVGLGSGVYYREFTKIMGFDGTTRLSLAHGHYLSLGLMMFLFFAILEANLGWYKTEKSTNKSRVSGKLLVSGYHIGLNIAAFGFIWRGTLEVLGVTLSKGLDASIAGISGLGHIVLSISLVWILLNVRKQA